jgi:hypothetical protein
MMELNMSRIECPVCDAISLLYLRSEQELIESCCLECRSPFMTIFNQDLFEEQIDWLRSQMI